MSERPYGQTSATVDDRELVSLLASKAESLSIQITDLLPSMESFIAVAATLIIGSVTFGVSEKQPELLVALPFPLAALLTYLVQSNTEMLSRAGYKAFLEDRINDLLKRRVLCEESDVFPLTVHGRTANGRGSVIVIQALVIALLLGVVALALTELDGVPLGFDIGFSVGLLVSGVMLFLAWGEQRKAYVGAYRAAKSAWEFGPPPPRPLLGQAASSHGES